MAPDVASEHNRTVRNMIHVLYHGPYCRDGFAAAYAAWLTLGDEGVEYHSMSYDDPLPAIAYGDTVYMLDYSRTADEIRKLAARNCLVTVIDHHKTAQAELESLGKHERCEVIFDMDKSGCVLAQEHFHPQTALYWGWRIFEYIQDRDLWRWELPGSREINQTIHSWPLDFDYWHKQRDHIEHIDDYLNRLERTGSALLEMQQRHIEQIAPQAHFFASLEPGAEDDNLQWVAVNCPLYQSDLLEYLLELHPGADVACSYWNTGKIWQLSLRSRKGAVDVSELAKRMGGGGHPNAAGCSFTVSPEFPGQRLEDLFNNER